MKKHFLSLLLLCAALTACHTEQTFQTTTQQDIDRLAEASSLAMPSPTLPTIPDKLYNVVDFGASNDGSALCTDAIQTAIDHASNAGGGTVVIPAGVYSTGPIELKSNVRLYTERNVLVLFSPDFHLYPIIDASFEGVNTKRCQSPISARNAENIAICGFGTFNGNGDAWRPLKRSKVTENQWKKHLKRGGVVSEDGNIWYPTEGALQAQALCIDQNVPENVEDWEAIHAFLRPVMLNFIGCKNILLENVCFENSPAWNLHPLMCENVVLNHLTVRNPWYSQNGDGVDIESCQNVIISDCSFDVGDDAICMKSGKNEDGRRRGIPAENIIVDGCTVYHGHGGFVVGSEMSGDVRNVSVSNCLFIGTDVGLRFKSTRGRGGIVENIYIRNINMSAIPNEVLLFDLFYGGKAAGEETEEEIAARMAGNIPAVTEETPQFRNITIENVICNGAKRAIYFNGLPEMKIQDVTLRDIRMTSEYGAQFNQTDGLLLQNVQIHNTKGEAFLFSNVDNLTQE